MGDTRLKLPLLHGVIHFLLMNFGVKVFKNAFDHFIIYFLFRVFLLLGSQTFQLDCFLAKLLASLNINQFF